MKFSDKVSGLQPSAIREILKFTSDPEVISFAAGNPAPEAFPVDFVSRVSADLLENNPILALQYSITEGYTPLRDLLKKRMSNCDCFNPSHDELIITSGAQQAVELACKVLCNEGDTLVCESPSFIGSLNSFRANGVKLAGVEQEEDGLKLDMLEKILRENKNAKLIYVIPNFQNPTGRTMSWEKRKGVYELAEKYDAVILEDNPYGDLRFDGEEIPSIKTLDKSGRVIYAGSFSKILAPGLRVGYASAPKNIIQKMVVCKQVEDVHSNIWAQAICERFMAECDLDAHFAHLRKIYRDKCRLMLDCIEKYFSEKISYTKPQGGLFIWATLPDDCDMPSFCKTAVQEYKVAVVPGNAFTMYDTDKTTSFRLNYSTPSDEQIIKGCEILGRLSKNMFD